MSENNSYLAFDFLCFVHNIYLIFVNSLIDFLFEFMSYLVMNTCNK